MSQGLTARQQAFVAAVMALGRVLAAIQDGRCVDGEVRRIFRLALPSR